jgi:hypothetical protein
MYFFAVGMPAWRQIMRKLDKNEGEYSALVVEAAFISGDSGVPHGERRKGIAGGFLCYLQISMVDSKVCLDLQDETRRTI